MLVVKRHGVRLARDGCRDRQADKQQGNNQTRFARHSL
jgi:hypothetical protein